jgi:hypothetical protein
LAFLSFPDLLSFLSSQAVVAAVQAVVAAVEPAESFTSPVLLQSVVFTQ